MLLSFQDQKSWSRQASLKPGLEARILSVKAAAGSGQSQGKGTPGSTDAGSGHREGGHAAHHNARPQGKAPSSSFIKKLKF